MEIKNISLKKFNSMNRLLLSDEILNTEAELYLYEDKTKWDKNILLFKKLYRNEGEIFSNKLYTINELIEKKDIIDMDELVLPDKLIAVKGEICGFTMPYIENINLNSILKRHDIPNNIKISYLKEVGVILEKLKKVRSYSSVKDFYLNDIHESNFIINLNTNSINVVDLDSCKIGNNMAQSSKYLCNAKAINNMKKYEKDKNIENKKYRENYNDIGGVFAISDNTELFCYNIMILNYLYNGNITNLSVDDFYEYLEYLKKLGVSRYLLDAFSLLYVEKDNVNPYELLDSLGEVSYKSCKSVFNSLKLKK